jgi:hypothetical protein
MSKAKLDDHKHLTGHVKESGGEGEGYEEDEESGQAERVEEKKATR